MKKTAYFLPYVEWPQTPENRGYFHLDFTYVIFLPSFIFGVSSLMKMSKRCLRTGIFHHRCSFGHTYFTIVWLPLKKAPLLSTLHSGVFLFGQCWEEKKIAINEGMTILSSCHCLQLVWRTVKTCWKCNSENIAHDSTWYRWDVCRHWEKKVVALLCQGKGLGQKLLRSPCISHKEAVCAKNAGFWHA